MNTITLIGSPKCRKSPFHAALDIIPTPAFGGRYELDSWPQFELEPRYNIAPSTYNPVITRNSPNKAVLMQWGLLPFWAKDPKTGYKTINARAETIQSKPTYRRPFQQQRCLIPASFFFEWQRQWKRSQPYCIRVKQEKVFSFAGIYDIWKGADGYGIKSYAIITTFPNELMVKIHHRMPVILKREDENTWLSPTTPVNTLQALLKPFPAQLMEAYKVSPMVNNPINTTGRVVEPLQECHLE